MTPPSADQAAPPRWAWARKAALVGAAVAAVVVALVAAPDVVPAAYLRVFGETTRGEVVSKREWIDVRSDGEWRHVFEVRYRFLPAGSNRPETGSAWTDATSFSTVSAGSPVQVRYSRSAWVRSWLPRVASALDGTSWLAGLGQDSQRRRDLFEWGAIGVVALLWLVAVRTGSRWLTFAAGIGSATIASAILLYAFLVLPIGVAAWRRRPGVGFGWALAMTAALSTAVIFARIPWPTPQPPGPQRQAEAVVRNVRRADSMWKPNSRRAGQPIPQPYDLLDLEFTPEGADAPVHALDRVDDGSVTGLSTGATVPIVYPVSDPRTARIRGASRDYARGAFVYVMTLTCGLGALVLLVVYPLVALLDRRVRASALGRVIQPNRS